MTMEWAIEVLAADPIPEARKWVPLMRTQYRAYRLETKIEAEDIIDAMRRSNHSLELRVVPAPDLP